MIRIDDLERLAKIHNDMLAAVAPYRDQSGIVYYAIGDSTKAINAIAHTIVLATTQSVAITIPEPAPIF